MHVISRIVLALLTVSATLACPGGRFDRFYVDSAGAPDGAVTLAV